MDNGIHKKIQLKRRLSFQTIILNARATDRLPFSDSAAL